MYQVRSLQALSKGGPALEEEDSFHRGSVIFSASMGLRHNKLLVMPCEACNMKESCTLSR